MGVPVLLVVEDNIRYYSAFLPVIYTELIKQSRRVIQEGIKTNECMPVRFAASRLDSTSAESRAREFGDSLQPY